VLFVCRHTQPFYTAGCPNLSLPLREVGSPLFKKQRQPRPWWAYPIGMAVNWIELAQKMAESARARVAADRKRLREILAERQRKQGPAQSSSHSQ